MLKPRHVLSLGLVALLLGLLAPPASLAAPAPLPPYAIVDLGSFGGPTSAATSINNRGQVVGVADTSILTGMPGDYQARGFLYESLAPTGLQDLTTPACTAGSPQLGSTALRINDQGVILGTDGPQTGGSDQVNFLYENGQKTCFNIPGSSVTLRDFNDAGQILGYRYVAGEVAAHAFVWTDGVMRELPYPYGNPWSVINDAGVVAGSIIASDAPSHGVYDTHAALVDGDAFRDIHAALGFPDYPFSTAADINDVGQVAGTVYTRDPAGASLRAYIYDLASGAVRDLGPGRALALNDIGQAVGYTQVGDSLAPALFSDGQARTLASLIPQGSGWAITSVVGINNAGQIIASGNYGGSGYARAILLSPRLFDVPASHPYHDAIAALADRGVIRGYEDGRFGPADHALRAQSAAFIARAIGWDSEDWPGVSFPDQGYIDDDLWRNVRTLAHYQVALGYEDGTYNPTGEVLHQQVILFIARAMIAKGYWVEQPDTNPYPNLPGTTAREQADRRAIATYDHYAGAVPDRPIGQAWADWDQPATRGWFAQVLWQALQSSTTP